MKKNEKTSQEIRYTAAVITVSDKGARGERVDASGPALEALLTENGWEVIFRTIVPDEREQIEAALLRCADELDAALILTTGGTGFSVRDVTPEATLAVIEREVRGIPEAMRAASMQITPKGCLSRSAAGIRGGSLIVNLPGSVKAARENIEAVISPVRHGVEILRRSLSDTEGPSPDCGPASGLVRAVCISAEKGTGKHAVPYIDLKVDLGIPGDAHAGKWHRQISLLAREDVREMEELLKRTLEPGEFAENILTEGIVLPELPVGTKLRVGTALCEVTQIGKECHQGCEIQKQTGKCVMPTRGIFARVLEDGSAKAGDVIQVVS
ncbi:MAG: molybdopterin-binding protein [Eubacteriales bacterium]|nr:molybdopterin-binding protein [Eubacteriales bacterium]